jgi:hypothetical protein
MLMITLAVDEPGGLKTLHVIEAESDGSGTPESGDYNVRLYTHDRGGSLNVRIKDFQRKDGELWLAKTALEALALALEGKL